MTVSSTNSVTSRIDQTLLNQYVGNVKNLSPAALSKLSASHIQALGDKKLDFSNAQLERLSNSALSAFSGADLTTMNTAFKAGVDAVTERLATTGANAVTYRAASPAVPSSSLSLKVMAKLNAAQIGGITDLSTFSGTQLASVTSAAWSSAKIDTITDPQISNLGAKFINGLSANQFKSLSTAQVNNLSADAMRLVRADHINSLDSTAVTGLKVANLTAKTVSQINPSVFKNFSADQLNTLSPLAVAGINGTQIAALAANGSTTATEFSDLSIKQISKLNTNAIGGLSTNQLATKATDGTYTTTLTKEQFGAIPANAINKLSPETMTALASLAGGLTKLQVNNLTGNQINSVVNLLNKDQMSALSKVGLQSISKDNFEKLTSEQLQGFSKAQVGQIELEDVVTLSVAKLSLMSDVQKSGFSKLQLGKLFLDSSKAAELGKNISILI